MVTILYKATQQGLQLSSLVSMQRVQHWKSASVAPWTFLNYFPRKCGNILRQTPTVRTIYRGGSIKPDIVVCHSTEKWAKIIEIAVSNDFALNRAGREKRNKYQDLNHDLKDTWNLEKVEILGATGLVKKKPCLSASKHPWWTPTTRNSTEYNKSHYQHH